MGIKMKNYIKEIVLFLCLVGSFSLAAQQFKIHTIEEGETLKSIAFKYDISTKDLVKYNREVKDVAYLSPNTILVIPTNDSKDSPVVSGLEKRKEETSALETPKKGARISFIAHKVQRNETLYGIAKKYGSTPEEIKRFNKQLYSSQLKRKMTIRIPQSERKEGVTIQSNESEATINVAMDDYENYVVAAKETRWSIAHKYGITINELARLNPELKNSVDYLYEGQILLVPKLAGASIEGQKSQLYISYTIPEKMTFYRLEKESGITSEEIIKLNPEITDAGGLKKDMVIRLPKINRENLKVNTENYIFYVVQPKENTFRLGRKFGLTWDQLLALNPELSGGLKSGMVLKLPKDRSYDFEVKNSLVLEKINLLDSINTSNQPKLMFLLPFRLDKLTLADKENTIWAIANRNSLKYSLGLYSGALVAIDSIKSLGISLDVVTFDNRLDLGRTKEILSQENLASYDAILGPLDAVSLKEVAIQASKHNVPVVAPMPAKSDISLENVFFSYTEDKPLADRMVSYVKRNFEEQQIIIIADEKSEPTEQALLNQFPLAKLITVKEEDENIGINRVELAGFLSEEHENWIFLESDNYKLIASVVSILNSFQNTLVDENNSDSALKLRLFTTNHSNAFENDVISGTHLSNLNFTFPSVYREVKSSSFSKRYKEKFGDDPDKFAVRGFDVTYDLLLKLAYNKNLLEASRFIGVTEYEGNKFSYSKDATSGYFNKASYILAYDNMHIIQVE